MRDLEPVDWRCPDAHLMSGKVGFGQRSHPCVPGKKYLGVAGVGKQDDTGLVVGARAFCITLQALHTPCSLEYRFSQKRSQFGDSYRRLVGLCDEVQIGGKVRRQDPEVSNLVASECIPNWDAPCIRNSLKFGDLGESAPEARDEPVPILKPLEQGHKSIDMSPRPVHPETVDGNLIEHGRQAGCVISIGMGEDDVVDAIVRTIVHMDVIDYLAPVVSIAAVHDIDSVSAI